MTDLDPLLRLLHGILTRLTAGLAAVRSQLVAMEAAEAARHGERMRMAQVTADAQKAQASAVRAALKALGTREQEEEDPVEDARRERSVAIVQSQTAAIRGARDWLGHAWERVWSEPAAKYRWAAYMAMAAVAREAWADYPILTAVLRGLEAAATSTGSTP